MPKYRDGWNDPPPTTTPLDHEPVNYARRGVKRGLVAGCVAGLAGLTYALMPIAFAFGGAAIGIWWIASDFRDWLNRRRDAADA